MYICASCAWWWLIKSLSPRSGLFNFCSHKFKCNTKTWAMWIVQAATRYTVRKWTLTCTLRLTLNACAVQFKGVQYVLRIHAANFLTIKLKVVNDHACSPCMNRSKAETWCDVSWSVRFLAAAFLLKLKIRCDVLYNRFNSRLRTAIDKFKKWWK